MKTDWEMRIRKLQSLRKGPGIVAVRSFGTRLDEERVVIAELLVPRLGGAFYCLRPETGSITHSKTSPLL